MSLLEVKRKAKIPKKMKSKNIFYIVIIAIFLASCEKVVNFELPDDSDKLAVFSFISPDDSITKVYVSHLVPVVSVYKTPKAITDAKVTITNNNKEYVLQYDSTYLAHIIPQSELKIKGDETYTLKVSAKGYNDASASITAISETNKSLEFVRFIKPVGQYNHEAKIELKWKDNPAKKNYYVLAMNKVDTTQQQDYYDRFFNLNSMLFYDDAGWNGKEKYSRDFKIFDGTNYQEQDDKPEYEIALINADKHYYLYHKKALEQDEFFDNPFTEPTIIYSNIENGVGVFCSYRKYIIRIKQ